MAHASKRTLVNQVRGHKLFVKGMSPTYNERIKLHYLIYDGEGERETHFCENMGGIRKV